MRDLTTFAKAILHGMKRVLVVILSFIPILLLAQNRPFPSNNNGEIVFSETVNSSYSSSEIKDLAKAWLLDSFPNAQLLEKEGQIAAKLSLEQFPVTFQDEVTQEFIYEKATFFITIDCKEQASQFRIHDISMVSVSRRQNQEHQTPITHGEHYVNIQYYCNCITNEKKDLQDKLNYLKGKKRKEVIENHNQVVTHYNRLIKFEEEIDEAEYQYFTDLCSAIKKQLQ